MSCRLCTGEVAAGLLIGDTGRRYLVVVGQPPKDSWHAWTMIYDVRDGTWTAGVPRPFVGNHHAAEVIDNELYLCGGLTEGESAIQIAALRETSAGVDVAWSLGPDLPHPSGSAATALIDGKVRMALPQFVAHWLKKIAVACA